jgi:hypothetical protein
MMQVNGATPIRTPYAVQPLILAQRRTAYSKRLYSRS